MVREASPENQFRLVDVLIGGVTFVVAGGAGPAPPGSRRDRERAGADYLVRCHPQSVVLSEPLEGVEAQNPSSVLYGSSRAKMLSSARLCPHRTPNSANDAVHLELGR